MIQYRLFYRLWNTKLVILYIGLSLLSYAMLPINHVINVITFTLFLYSSMIIIIVRLVLEKNVIDEQFSEISTLDQKICLNLYDRFVKELFIIVLLAGQPLKTFCAGGEEGTPPTDSSRGLMPISFKLR